MKATTLSTAGVWLKPHEVKARLAAMFGDSGRWRYKEMVRLGVLRRYYFYGNKSVPYYALEEVNQALTPQPEEDL